MRETVSKETTDSLFGIIMLGILVWIWYKLLQRQPSRANNKQEQPQPTGKPTDPPGGVPLVDTSNFTPPSPLSTKMEETKQPCFVDDPLSSWNGMHQQWQHQLQQEQQMWQQEQQRQQTLLTSIRLRNAENQRLLLQLEASSRDETKQMCREPVHEYDIDWSLVGGMAGAAFIGGIAGAAVAISWQQSQQEPQQRSQTQQQ